MNANWRHGWRTRSRSAARRRGCPGLAWRKTLPAALLLAALALEGCVSTRPAPAPRQAAADGAAETQPAAEEREWTRFFQNDSLEGWAAVKEDDFEHHGRIWAENGTLMLDAGMPSTGLVWTGPFPRENYEIRLEAMRRSDMDIFCGIHFPVGGEYVSLLAGGWSDTVVGLSCVNGARAAYNETCAFMKFQNGRWYDVHVLVTSEKIEVRIDGRSMFTLEREGRRIHDCRGLDALRPFGFFTWNTAAALRNVRARGLAE